MKLESFFGPILLTSYQNPRFRAQITPSSQINDYYLDWLFQCFCADSGWLRDFCANNFVIYIANYLHKTITQSYCCANNFGIKGKIICTNAQKRHFVQILSTKGNRLRQSLPASLCTDLKTLVY